jgi:hypothetical protein
MAAVVWLRFGACRSTRAWAHSAMPINALAEAKPRSSVIEQRSPKPRASSILAAGIPFTTHDVRELARKSAVFREKTASDRVALSTAELDLLAGSAQGHRVSIGSRHTSCPAGAWAPHMARVSQTCAGDDFFHCPLFGPDTRRRSADLRLRRRELIAPAGRRCQREAEARESTREGHRPHRRRETSRTISGEPFMW